MSEPVWTRPAWLTAVAVIVTALITIPEQGGIYLDKQQTIASKKQIQEIGLVSRVLNEKGTERVFVLRYLSQTIDDEDAKRWASSEVARLDKLSDE